MNDISRRTAATLLAGAPVLALLGCTAPRARPQTAVPTTQPASWITLAKPAPASAPEYGPTGAHWPARTPQPGEKLNLSIEVDCSWSAIASAITTAVAKQPKGKVAILVRPGILPGFGAGSTAKPVLKGVGAKGRPYRILVTPRDGAGTVTHSDSLRLELVSGVSFVGFWPFPNSVVISACTDVSWAWSKVQALNITANSSAPTDGIDLVECVTPQAQLKDSDTWGFRTVDQSMTNISMIGCYVSPSYKAAASSAHCDSLQLSGSLPVTGLTIQDTVIFASTNAGVIPSGGSTGILFDHSLVVGGDKMLLRYPLPDGANAFTSGYPLAVNGTGSVDQLSSVSSIFLGGVQGTWLNVEDTQVSGKTQPRTTSGAFTVDSALSTVDGEWLDARTTNPTDAVLRAIWSR